MRQAPRRIATLAASAALVVLATAPASLPGGHQARAADRGLVMIAQTTYQALPEDRRIHVTIDAVATSYTPNPADGLAYYPATEFAAQAGATNFTASSGADTLAVDVDPSDPDFVAVTVTFADWVYYQESYPFRVAFDLPDPGGAPDRDFRISPSIVAFPIWAFGSEAEPGSSVTVVLPGGFRPDVQGATLTSSTGAEGEVVLSTGVLSDPFAFFAFVSGDRPGAFTDTLLEIELGGGESAPVQVRAWQDDQDWGTAMTSLLTAGLPALEDLIGLPYDAPGTLVVEEAATSRLGEYAGIYNRLTGIIRVRYDADGVVGLHEAAHVWFNGDFLRGRWIGEAWAEFYAVRAAESIGRGGEVFDLTDELLEFKIALNDWGVIGAVELGVEEYAYAASYHLAVLIFERAGVAGLQSVWRAVDAAEMAYQPANSAGAPATGVDFDLDGWQQVLDLLDERTGSTYDDLWIEWVVSTDQQGAMADRADAREHYAAVVLEAADWNLPTDLRYAMGSWEFEAAEADLDLAAEVLAARDEIAADAGELGLTPPAALQDAFEGDDGLAAAFEEATHELGVLAGIAAATDRLDDEKSPFEILGLLGSDPEATLESARDAFEDENLDTAADDAAEALATREGAESAGQLRAAIGGGGLVILGGGTLVAARFRRRHHHRLIADAAPAIAAPDSPAPAEDSPGDPR
ncbi:MAG: hypothetical protein WD116_03715 [Chloroflexota bacterium]